MFLLLSAISFDFFVCLGVYFAPLLTRQIQTFEKMFEAPATQSNLEWRIPLHRHAAPVSRLFAFRILLFPLFPLRHKRLLLNRNCSRLPLHFASLLIAFHAFCQTKNFRPSETFSRQLSKSRAQVRQRLRPLQPHHASRRLGVLLRPHEQN